MQKWGVLCDTESEGAPFIAASQLHQILPRNRGHPLWSGDTCLKTIIITILTIIFTCERDYILEIYVLLMVYYLDQVALIYQAFKSEKKIDQDKDYN